MPELMLYYRSATLFTRLYAPEITMGIQTAEEMADLGFGKAIPVRPIFESTNPKTRSQAKAQLKEQKQIRGSRAPGGHADQKNKTAAKRAAQSVGEQPAAITTPSSAQLNAQYDYLKALTGLIGLSKHSENDVLKFLSNTQRCDASCADLAEVANKQPKAIIWAHNNWQALERELTHLKRATV